jgi:MFS family permease
MGFGIPESLALTAPPQVGAMIVAMVMAHYSDKWKLRWPFLLTNGFLALIGCALLAFTDNVGVRYFGAFITAIGVNANIPANLTWQANNVRGQWRRAFVSALNVSMAGMGGIMASLVFRGQDAPTYLPGTIACMICGALSVFIVVSMTFYFAQANKKADEGKRIIEGLEGFRYTL